MTAIYARTKSEWAERVREELLEAGIPCALVGPEYGNTHLIRHLPFIIPAPDCGEMNDRLLKTLPAAKILTWSADVPPIVAIREAYQRYFGTEPEFLHRSGIRISGGEIRFRGEPLRLTANEKRILLLLVSCAGTYFTADETAALCLRNAKGSAAAVHICHLNAKAKKAAYASMIECRRYKGYCIPVNPQIAI